MTEQVMVYEVKNSAASNAQHLISPDQNYFYWNDKAFKNLTIGDYVFVVINPLKKVLFTRLDDRDISTRIEGNTSTFNNLGTEYKPTGHFDKFIRLAVISIYDTRH